MIYSKSDPEFVTRCPDFFDVVLHNIQYCTAFSGNIGKIYGKFQFWVKFLRVLSQESCTTLSGFKMVHTIDTPLMSVRSVKSYKQNIKGLSSKFCDNTAKT